MSRMSVVYQRRQELQKRLTNTLLEAENAQLNFSAPCTRDKIIHFSGSQALLFITRGGSKVWEWFMNDYIPKFSEVEVDGVCQAVCTPISYCRETMLFPKVMFCSRGEKIKYSMIEI